MTKAEEAKQYHQGQGVICGTCKHFRTLESRFAEISYCDLSPVGRGRWESEYCNLWEEHDDTQRSF